MALQAVLSRHPSTVTFWASKPATQSSPVLSVQFLIETLVQWWMLETVMATQDGHILGKQVLARIHLMAPVCRALKGVSAERHVTAAADADAHSAAKALLACGIRAVNAVEARAGLAHDGDVLGVGSRQDGLV